MTIVLAFDLETAPDTDAGRRLYGLTGTDAEVAAAMLARRLEETDGRTDFLKPAFHRVVGVGAAAVAIGSVAVDASVRAYAGPNERDLISQLLGWLQKRPQLVSWNGGGFDLPVIRYRALVHGLSASAMYGPAEQRQFEAYAYRYGEAHVDLMDALAGYGASPSHGLDEMARVAGLPGKTIATGQGVAGLALAGEWERIEHYVASDAVQTLLLFLRWQASRGRIAQAPYVRALRAIWAKLVGPELRLAIESWVAEATETAVPVPVG